MEQKGCCIQNIGLELARTERHGGMWKATAKRAVHAQRVKGTDEMIIRAAQLYNNYFQNNNFGPVLVKIPKLNQNFNLDLPVIGLETIKKCNELGFSSIVLSSKGTLITEIDIVKNYLKKNKFCIYAI